MNRQIRITVAESSAIIRMGLIAILRQLYSRSELFEVEDAGELRNALGWQKPDVLIINTSFFALHSMQQIKKEAAPGMKYIALSGGNDGALQRFFDDTLSIYDTADQIREKINRLTGERSAARQHESLSQREKQVIACVIQGMTNKQIADKLCLSAHTVITHRRNISAKLGIHSTAGLTIYAIVNKLVDLDSISAEQAE